MRVGYKSQADKLHVDLVDADHSDHGDDSIPLTVVELAGEDPIGIDLLEVSTHGTDAPLRAVAHKYGLDADELVAAGRAAYETPDRTITLDFA
jgi:hypothetical protein